MNTPLKLTAFALGLVAAFATAAGVGSAVGPVGPAATPAAGMAGHGGSPTHGGAAGADESPAGLMIAADGYTLALDDVVRPTGAATPVSFRILGPDGHAVTAFDDNHDKGLHLIAVRRDLSGYQHVHPTLDRAGTWRTALALSPGTWRLIADFVPTSGGTKRALGADLSVAGAFAPVPLAAPSSTVDVDGYTVTLSGTLTPRHESGLTLSVRRNGRPVTDLQPYLAAYGHLVVVRDGDLGYLHVHPTGEPGDGSTKPGPDVSFMTTAPSAGTYRLFLDFRHGGVVHTAQFTVTAHEKGRR